MHFSLNDAEIVIGGYQPADLPHLAQCERKPSRLAALSPKHRRTLGIDNVTPWAVPVTSEVGRVLLVLLL